MNDNPKVSIIIPTWNRGDLIGDAIKSVLAQNFTDYELLILDDASTDDTHHIVSFFLQDKRIRYIKHPQNVGITANRNYGLSIAQGEYIAMLDSDDVWLSKNKLQKQINFLHLNLEYGLIGTYATKIDKDGNIIKKSFKDLLSDRFATKSNFWMRMFFLIRNQIFHSSVVIRKKAIEESGPYEESLPIWEDYELWLRIGTKYKVRNIPDFMTGYRVHEKNITKEDKIKGLEASFRILRMYKDKYPNYYLGYLKLWLKKNIKQL
jgi:glycosyltransferase involved in cell wall biosynthesis